MQQSAHRLHIGVTSVVQHPAHHPSQALLQSGGAFLEGLKPTASGPADLRLRQRQADALGVGSTHVLADMLDLRWLAAVGLELGCEVQHALMVASLAGKQQALGLQVVHERDVALSFTQAGLVNADDADAGHVVQRPRRVHVVFNAPPQLFVRAAQQRCGLAHRQLLTQRQGKGLKQGRKPAVFVRPGHLELAGLAAGVASNAGHISVQLRLELKDVQVTPLTARSLGGRRRRSEKWPQRG